MTRKDLLRIINNKPVCVAVHGLSVKNLADRGKEFQDFDVCWASLNHFNIIENNILIPHIGKNIKLLYMSSALRIQQNMDNIKEFLRREQMNCWITNQDIKYNEDKTYYDKDNPAHGEFNTLTAFIVLLMQLKVKKVFLFGADGGSNSTKEVYYKQDEFNVDTVYEGTIESKHTDMHNDSLHLNAYWKGFCINNCLPKETKVYNVSPDSQITVFSKVTYDEAIKLLKR